MPKRALIKQLYDKCNLWLMRDSVNPPPEIFAFNPNDIEEDMVAAAVDLIKQLRPDAVILLDGKDQLELAEAVNEIDDAIVEQDCLIINEKIAGNIVKENYHKGMHAGLRIAKAAIGGKE